MDKLKKAALVLSLVENAKNEGSWCGKTHVQKGMYFLQHMLDVPTDFEYILYKHGPYSFDLRKTLAYMRTRLWLDKKRMHSSYGPSIIPGEAALALQKEFEELVNEYHLQVSFVAERITHQSANTLERLATAYHVMHTMGVEGKLRQAEQLRKLKPHIGSSAARKAVQRVEELIQEAEGEDLLRKAYH